MVVKIKLIIFLIIIANMLSSFGQNSTVRGIDPEKTLLVICKMVFEPKDTLNPIIKSKFCDNESKTFFLNGLELPFDSLVKLQLSYKNTLRNQCFYDLKYNEDDSLNCIAHINYYITIKIPIFLNGKEISLEQSVKILGRVLPNELLSIQRVKKKERIEITTKLKY
jgi:hypothetical protein